MKKQSLELLAPAGSFESLKAAVANGADAVYLGGGKFNARVNAGNFMAEELISAIDYAHERGVRVYLTLNTLLKNKEINEAVDFAAFAYEQGADAVIVQDMGLLKQLRELIPEFPLHASTQMTVTNRESVKVLEGLGATRIVLSRELALDQIQVIAHSGIAEIEVFVHGALCLCYSGQCLMSSFIGGRSGNRGLCAQPCRLPWALSHNGQHFCKEGYLLSPRDLMAIDLLPELKKAGVTSLKLEGRMKSPEYVAIVTKLYRKYIDLVEQQDVMEYRVTDEDKERLMQAFNRGGFTQHYLKGERTYKNLIYTRHPKNQGVLLGTITGQQPPYVRISLERPLNMGDGIEIMDADSGPQSLIVTAIMHEKQHVREAPAGSSPWVGDIRATVSKGSPVYRTLSKLLFEEARLSYERGEAHLVPLKMTVKLKAGEPLELLVYDDDGNKTKVVSTVLAEKALKKAMTTERLREQLQKTGDTPYYLEHLEVVTDQESTVPVSALNALRREALEALKAQRIQKYKRSLKKAPKPEPVGKPGHFPGKKHSLAASFIKPPESLLALNGKVSRVYLPVTEREELERLAATFEGEVFLWTPSVLKDDELEALTEALKGLEDLFAGLTYGSLGALSVFTNAFPGKLFCSDSSMNVFNDCSANLLAQMGTRTVVLSPELNLRDIKDLENPSVALESYVYGRIPLMIMEYCPSAVEGACSGRCESCVKYKGFLKDRKGEVFPFLRDPWTKRTRIFNAHPLIMEDMALLKETPVSYLRLAFMDEDEETMRGIVDFYSAGIRGIRPPDYAIETINGLKSRGFTKGHWFRGVE